MTDHKTLRACLQRIGDEFDGLRAERATMTGPPDARQLFTDETLRRTSERWWSTLASIAVREANDLDDLRILADTVLVLHDRPMSPYDHPGSSRSVELRRLAVTLANGVLALPLARSVIPKPLP